MNKPNFKLQSDKVVVNHRPSSDETALKIVTIAEDLVKQGQVEQALINLNQAANLKPGLVEIYILRAEIYRQKGEMRKALADLNRNIELSPDNSTAYVQRGEIYRLLKQPQQALDDLNQAVRLAPNNPLALGRRGTIYRNLMQYNEALADYNQALKLDPTNTWLYGNRAETYRGLKDYTRAISDYNQVLKLNPAAVWVHERRSYPYLWVNNLEKAHSDFMAAWQASPGNLMNGWMAEWTRMCQSGFTFSVEARDRLKALANAEPKHYAAYLCRASLYWQIHVALRESYKQAEVACDMLPDEPEGYFWKGLAAAGLKEDDEAVFLLQKALDLGLPPALLSPLKWLININPPFYNKFYSQIGLATPGTENSGTVSAFEPQEQVKPKPTTISEFNRPTPKAPVAPNSASGMKTQQPVTSQENSLGKTASSLPAAETGKDEGKFKVRSENVGSEVAPPTGPTPARAVQPINHASSYSQPGENAGNGQGKAGQNTLSPTNNNNSLISPHKEIAQIVKPASMPLPEEPTSVHVKAQQKSSGPVEENVGKHEDINGVTLLQAEYGNNSASGLKKSKRTLLKPALIGASLFIVGLLVFFLAFFLVFNPAGEKPSTGNNPVAVAISVEPTSPTVVPKELTIPATAALTTPALAASATPIAASGQPSVSAANTDQVDPTAALAIYATPASPSVGSSQPSAALSPTPNLSASSSFSPTVTVVSATTLKPTVSLSTSTIPAPTLTAPVSLAPADIQLLTGQSGIVTTASWSRDGRYFATGSEDKTIGVWEAATHTEILILAPKDAPLAGTPIALSWSSNNDYLVSGWTDTHVRVFRVFPASNTSNKNEAIGQITTEVTDNVLPQAVDISADNSLITYPGKDVLHTKNNSNNFKGPDFLLGGFTQISAVKFSQDGKFIAAGLSDGRTIIWDRATLKTVLVILPNQNGSSKPVKVLDWTADNKYLAIGGQGNLTLYQVTLSGGGKIVNIPITQATRAPISALELSTDNNWLAVGYENGDVQLWSIDQLQPIGQLNSGSGAILGLNFSSDNHQISAIKGGNQPALIKYLHP